MLSTNRHQIDNEFLLGVLFGIMEKCVDKSNFIKNTYIFVKENDF